MPSMEMEWKISNEAELDGIVDVVLEQAGEVVKREDGAAILALTGDLGAGKTTFMQHVAKKLGIEEHVTSPTFVVMKKYDTKDDTIQYLTHIDAYRIEDIDEMRPLRFGEECEQNHTMIAIEWAEHVAPLLPESALHLTITLEGETRIMSLTDA